MSITSGSAPVAAKTPGETYCYYGTCHRVKSIAETEALVGFAETLPASFYDSCKKDKLNPCGLTSSGEAFNPDAPDNAASPIYPDGTTLLVWSPETREAAVVRVNNAGPYWGDRKLDVSRATAERLGFKDRGVTDLEVRVIDAPATEQDATYQKNRTYERVPGYIGQYESLDAAHAGMAAAMALEAMAPSMLAPSAGAVVAAGRTGLPTPPPEPVVASAAPAAEAVANAAPMVAAAPVEAEPPKPAVVAAAAPVPSEVAKPVVAGLVAPKAEEEKAAAAAEVQRVAEAERVSKQPKLRKARVAANNRVSKAAAPRVAARYANVKKSPRATARKSKPTAVASAKPVLAPKPKAREADHPNDWSVFARQSYSGTPRVAVAPSRSVPARAPVRLAYRDN